MTLSTEDRLRLLNSHERRCKVRFWLFDALPELANKTPNSGDNIGQGTQDLAVLFKPLPLISPSYALCYPGEGVVLYGGDSWERGGGAATGHTWALVSGTASLAPSGVECTVTPLVEDEVVTVSLTVMASNGNTATRYAYVVASTDGWASPAGQVSLQGSYEAGGWSGEVSVLGDDASVLGLDRDKLLLVHIETTYDGQAVTIGGYKRSNNLALLRVEDWTYDEDETTGQAITRIQLASPVKSLERQSMWELYSFDSERDYERGLTYAKSEDWFNYAFRHATFRLTDAIVHIAGESGQSQYYNFTVFHDSQEFGSPGVYVLPVDDIWTQMKSTIESIMGIAFVNYMGSVQLIPSPSVRADEWWGTPSPRWDATNPLSKLYALDYQVHWRPDQADGLILKGYDSANLPVTIKIGDQERYVETLEGYILVDAVAATQWGLDLFAMINRDWDVTVQLACPGNTLNVGDFTYVDFVARQAGHPVAQGLGYVNGIQHNIDINTGMQVTVASIVQITNWSS